MASEPDRRGVNYRFAAGLILLAILGCGGEPARHRPYGRRAMEVAKLPKPIHAAAKKAWPQITWEEAWENLDGAGKITSYEVRGRAPNGKIREVRVSPSGEVLESE
jgi:hypothetical protein